MGAQEQQYYRSLYEVAAAINSAHTIEKVLSTLVETAAKAAATRGCALMLLTPDRKRLLHIRAAHYGLSVRYVRKGPVSADRSIAEALEGKAVAIADAASDARIEYREEAEREGIKSILSVPVRLGTEVIGALKVYAAERRHFTADDVYFLSAIANLGAISLENARLYETTRKDYDAFRRETLEWRAALGHRWMIQDSVTGE